MCICDPIWRWKCPTIPLLSSPKTLKSLFYKDTLDQSFSTFLIITYYAYVAKHYWCWFHLFWKHKNRRQTTKIRKDWFGANHRLKWLPQRFQISINEEQIKLYDRSMATDLCTQDSAYAPAINRIDTQHYFGNSFVCTLYNRVLLLYDRRLQSFICILCQQPSQVKYLSAKSRKSGISSMQVRIQTCCQISLSQWGTDCRLA